MAQIAVVIPVLNRPHRVEPLLANLFASTEVEIEVMFVCTGNDVDQIRAVNASGENFTVIGGDAGPGDFARKQNRGFAFTWAPHVLLGADDLEFTPGWDTVSLETAKRTGAGVTGINDDANPLVKRGRHATHPIVSRDYIETVGGTWHDGPGIVYSEAYSHQYVDTELVEAAKERGQWAFAFGSTVIHHHPIYDRHAQMDATYTKALADASADRRVFIERQQRAKANRVGTR